MQRDIDSLRESFDLLVIGGGIYGAALARLAARSGWRVALVEREDFGGATSRNCAKLVHGGLRYVQHLDLPRLRESVAAQRDWRAAAPHLVRPMRFVIPTHGAGARGPAALAAGILVYELGAIDRNRGVADTVRLPRAGIMGRRALLQRFPMLDGPGVNGGAWWYDAQMLDASRLTLECVVDAVAAGAAAVNHAEAVALIEHRGTVEGAVVRDRIGGRELEVRARLTINATGPWMERLLPRSASRPARPPLFWSRNVNLVTRRLFDGDTAIGVASRRPADAVAVFFPSCVDSLFGTAEGDGVTAAFAALCDRAGLSLAVPDGVAGLCCGTPWRSKGLTRGYAEMARRTFAAVWDASDGGRLPVVCPASSCAHGLRELGTALDGDELTRLRSLTVLDAVTYVRAQVLPRLTVRRRLGAVTVHPTCASEHLGATADLTAVAAACAEEVVTPTTWGCCGFAGDRGLLHPEVTAGATAAEAAEVGQRRYDAYVSNNRTCELGMTRATGRPYRHVLELLEEVTR